MEKDKTYKNGRPQKLTQFDKSIITILYKNGYEINRLCKMFEVSKGTLYRAITPRIREN